jgi:hypothetical protein
VEVEEGLLSLPVEQQALPAAPPEVWIQRRSPTSRTGTAVAESLSSFASGLSGTSRTFPSVPKRQPWKGQARQPSSPDPAERERDAAVGAAVDERTGLSLPVAEEDHLLAGHHHPERGALHLP